uniref:Uncharacterized protein n=1 Tax=Solanum lycopersicum TaxID=4081 RepID=A0A3Q7EAP5_SOLLC
MSLWIRLCGGSENGLRIAPLTICYNGSIAKFNVSKDEEETNSVDDLRIDFDEICVGCHRTVIEVKFAGIPSPKIYLAPALATATSRERNYSYG